VSSHLPAGWSREIRSPELAVFWLVTLGLDHTSVARDLPAHGRIMGRGDSFDRTILRRGSYQNMQRMFLGIAFLSVIGLAFGLMVALDRLIGG